MLRILSLYLIISTLPVSATTQRVDHYDLAKAEAAKSHQPYAIVLHGSSWHKASQLFLDQLWYNNKLSNAVKYPLIISDIHIHQGLTKEESEKAMKHRKEWKNHKISSFPALQFYDSKGSLLKTYQGTELRKIASIGALSSHLNGLIETTKKRDLIYKQIAQARINKDKWLEAELLGKIVTLPINFDKKSLLEQFKEADPEDITGWQAQLNFNNWGYMRHITGLINKQKIVQALQETEDALKKDKYTHEQRCIILGARGKALAANGGYVQAWQNFQLAKKADPNGPVGNAIYNYGVRVAMLPSRSGFPRDSTIYGKDFGENISRDHASFTMSSITNDNPEHHASLFTGDFSPTGFAFHTDKEKNAHIIIDLQSICTIKALYIMNRSERNTQQRAATLELHISRDQKNWNKVWQAEQAKNDWSIMLEKPVAARYLRLGLNSPQPEHLHLKAVSVFGERPQ